LLKHLTLTGLASSQMKKYVLDGTCAEFELWNPSNLGYLAGLCGGVAGIGLITGKPGQTFSAGKLGSYKILPASGTTALGRPRPADGVQQGQYQRSFVQLLTKDNGLSLC